MPITEDTSGRLRGYDADGHKVVVGWTNGDGTEYLVPLTKCCEACVSIFEDGTVYCKACYGEAPMHLCGEGRIETPIGESP